MVSSLIKYPTDMIGMFDVCSGIAQVGLKLASKFLLSPNHKGVC